MIGHTLHSQEANNGHPSIQHQPNKKAEKSCPQLVKKEEEEEEEEEEEVKEEEECEETQLLT